jgi:hypothetical protein
MSLCEYKILKKVKDEEGEKFILNENYSKYVALPSLPLSFFPPFRSS